MVTVSFEDQPIQECWFCGFDNPCRPDVWNKKPACEQCWHQVKEETRGWRKVVEDEGMEIRPGEIAAHILHASILRDAK